MAVDAPSLGGTAQYVDVDGIRTRYFDAGSGPPLVLWHGDEFGGVGSASTWSRNLAGLARNFRVIAADRLGQGFTDVPSAGEDYTVEAVLRHMRGFLQTLGLGPMHVAGQSRGGYFATRLALEEPDLVRSLVIVDTATLAPEVGDVQQRLDRLLAGAPADLRAYAAHRWSRLSYSAEHLTDDYLDEVGEMSRRAPAQQARPTIERQLASTFVPSLGRQKEETLAWLAQGRLRCPTLLVWGHDDPLAPLQSGLQLFDLLCKTVPRARLHVFNQAGHFPYREHAAEFDALVTSFVASARDGANEKGSRNPTTRLLSGDESGGAGLVDAAGSRRRGRVQRVGDELSESSVRSGCRPSGEAEQGSGVG